MSNLINNPFGNGQDVVTRPSGGALSNTDQQRAIAEVQAAMVVARSNPRNPVQAMDNILNACTRQSLAESAIYQYARGGTDISGPSIRLAEAVAQHWGNIQFGVREIDQSNGSSTVQAYAWDVETNTRREMVFQVPHIRNTRNGSYQPTDARDIYELVASQGARRLRACILSVIPGDVIEAAVKQCNTTLLSTADVSEESIKKLAIAFEEFGITKNQIEKRIQRRLSAIQPAQVVQLRNIYVSLRDGMSSPEEWFESEEEQPKTDKENAEKTATKTEALKKTLASHKE